MQFKVLGNVIAANIWGKLKTVTQMLAIILVFADKYNFFDFVSKAGTMGTGYLIVNILSSVLMAISVVATIFSGWSYLKGGKDLLKDA